MHRRFARALAALFLVSLCVPATGFAQAAASTPQVAAERRIQVPRVEAAPKLDDYASGTGPGVAVSDFRQREPGDLTPAGEKTTAFLSYDATSLYVAFVCKAQDPSSVRARMSRRESIFDDDFVAVHLDTFHDRQRAYMFFSNPLGIQADGVTTEGAGDDMSFDTVWTSTGRRTADRLRRADRDPVQEPALSLGRASLRHGASR